MTAITRWTGEAAILLLVRQYGLPSEAVANSRLLAPVLLTLSTSCHKPACSPEAVLRILRHPKVSTSNKRGVRGFDGQMKISCHLPNNTSHHGLCNTFCNVSYN